jgi:uncharacterized phiE125 gp8 family phage protein
MSPDRHVTNIAYTLAGLPPETQTVLLADALTHWCVKNPEHAHYMADPRVLQTIAEIWQRVRQMEQQGGRAMNLMRISAPAAPVISLAEIRAQARVDDDNTLEDALLAGYIRSAQDYVEQQLGKVLITSTWTYTLSWFPPGLFSIRIPLEPIQSVDEISYVDTSGVTQIMPTTDYALFGHGQLLPAYGKTWPSTRCPSDVVIRVTAGFGDDHNSVPEPIRQSVMLLATFYFEQRSAATFENDPPIPFGVDALLSPYKSWSL